MDSLNIEINEVIKAFYSKKEAEEFRNELNK